MATKPKFVNVTTPVGIAVYPKLNAPDTKYKVNGEFTVRLKLAEADAAPLIEKYEAELAKHFEAEKAALLADTDPKTKGKSKVKAAALKLANDKPYKPEFDEEGNETGFMLVNFKMPHRIIREGKPDLLLYPDVFDASGKKLKVTPEIWGGTKLAVAGQLRPFNTNIGVGLSMRLQAVQIHELMTAGSRDAGGYGFGASEGGYEGSDEEPAGGGFGGEDAPTGSDNPDF